MRQKLFGSLALLLGVACIDDTQPEYGVLSTGYYESSDSDSDGFNEDEDCDDYDFAVNPDADELCDDSIDNDCDELTDEEDPDCQE